MLTHSFEPGFRIDLNLKDLKNCLDLAQSVNAELPLSNLIYDMLRRLVEQGYGLYDHSALSIEYDL